MALSDLEKLAGEKFVAWAVSPPICFFTHMSDVRTAPAP
jgi:hypothetical protein